MTPPLPPPLLDFQSPDISLESTGGKGLNLGRLSRRGFPVPEGFILPAAVYVEAVDSLDLGGLIRQSFASLVSEGTPAPPVDELERVSRRIRDGFRMLALPAALVSALQQAYSRMGQPPVAVRSSATAEDLPEMSFAGQHDTFLNVIGPDDLCRAVVDCWSSLWTARAIGYRMRNGIPHEQVSLAVVVQKMIPAQVSGVMFTANPLTGKRTESVIDATLGLGEALVSGQVEPDHYVVDHQQERILKRTLGSKNVQITSREGGGTLTQEIQAAAEQALPDEAILRLASLGQRVAAVYEFPQDIEWAWYCGDFYLLQSRPITSLFPLPEGLPIEPLRVMMALSVVQGVMEPLTPLGQDALKSVFAGGGKLFGYDIPLAEQQVVSSAADRLYLDFTAILTNSVGRRILPRMAEAIDPGVAQAYRELVQDPRLTPRHKGIRLDTLRRMLGLARRIFARVIRYWRDPQGQRQRFFQRMDEMVAEARSQAGREGDLWQDYQRHLRLLLGVRDIFPDLIVPYGLSAVVAGMAPFFGILQESAQRAARASESAELELLPMEIARGLPGNVTTEMDLALWETARCIRAHEASTRLFNEAQADDLTRRYLADDLPGPAQEALAAFLAHYGMRGIGEIDLGRPRWREDPEHILRVLQGYLKIEDASLAPDVVFQRGAQEAEKAAARLEAAVRSLPFGWLRAKAVRWAVSRYRALAGLREAPKFFAIRMMAPIRQAMLLSGQAFVEAGLLEQADDLFFLYIGELVEIDSRRTIPPAMRRDIQERRARRRREMLRRQLPRVLLSDGTAYYAGVTTTGSEGKVIAGSPVSPGVVVGEVRVVFSPTGSQLEPGEILVCPGTDPAWTPLFLTAGGLVMETGGMMTHGSVVAREYGIPAVVGVHDATRRLRTGQRIRLDGSAGRIELLESQAQEQES